jgi:hypothetical protein
MLLGHKNLLIFSFSTIVLQKLSRLAYYNYVNMRKRESKIMPAGLIAQGRVHYF